MADDTLVTMRTLGLVLEKAGRATREQIEKMLTPFGTRLSTIETRTAALAGLFAKGDTEKRELSQVEAMIGPILENQRGMMERLDRLFKLIDSQARTISEQAKAIKALRDEMPQYVGTYRADGTVYARNSFATFDGSMWAALRATNARPGTPDSGWQLAVKRGRDSREVRDGATT